MKLYGSEQSPFVARIWIACEAKGIEVDNLGPPAAGLKSPEYLAINPVGKVPALIDDDTPIIESETILDYIEDCHPAPPLRPAAPLADDEAHPADGVEEPGHQHERPAHVREVGHQSIR